MAALAAVVMAPGVAAAAAPFVDDTAAEFGAGTTGASTQVTAGGSVELARIMKAQDLNGWLPATSWDVPAPPPAGTGTVSGGILTLDGARATAPRSFSANPVTQTLEFTATFGAASNQHVGFGNVTNGGLNTGSTYDDGPWAMFSTKDSGGTTLYARTLSGPTANGGTGVAQETPVAGPFDPTVEHKYRIVWTATGVDYFIVDGPVPVAVASHPAVIATNMRPAASDLTTGGPALKLSAVSLQLYADTGAFESRVFDAGDARTVWGKLTPAVTGTGATFETHSGNTAVPDSSWSAYQPIAADGSIQSPSGRYIQYRATLTTANDTTTPSLTRVELAYDIDAAAPTTALDVQLSGTTATATFSSPDADVARFECSQDNGAYATCTSPKVFTGLAPGARTFSVKAVDKLGNVGAAVSKTVTVAAPGGTTPPPSGGGNNPPADTTKPNVLVLGRNLKVSSSGVAKMRIRCPRTETRCAVTVKLKKGGKRIARKSLTIPGGSTTTVRLKLSSAARAALAAKGKIKASAVITATDAAGNSKTTTRKVTLRAPGV